MRGVLSALPLDTLVPRPSFLVPSFFALWLFPFVSTAVSLDPAIVKSLASDESDDKIAAIAALAKAPSDQVVRMLQALGDDRLVVDGERVLVVDGGKAFDAVTGTAVGDVPSSADAITINNRVRRELGSALAGMRLFSNDPEVRLAAARQLASSADDSALPSLDRALAQETDASIKASLQLAHAKASLASDDAAVRLASVKALAASSDPATRELVAALIEKRGDAHAEPDESVRAAARKSLASIDARLVWGDNLGRVFTGLSLGSVLLLAALGLAITYGVMGVINMAHGELLMVGAYATWSVQALFRTQWPAYLDWYLVAALPIAFLSAAIVGALMERLVIRKLYGRPLETLLATFGLSLILIQAARTLFGAQNVEVANPSWMSGGIALLPNLVLPWNRIVIIAFSVAVLAGMWALMNTTRLGLFVRAVTQNRPMAGCVGVATTRIDALAFALGAGIAGLGGVALSQIANVGPDMGQAYIVDSFMVVVLGGVGQLAGAVWAALGLGVVTKFLEGWTGAVIAKIVVLVFIIVFIQKRPQGLFAIKGRAVES
ncbi:MAG TPA: urea ABC transporter permease subunit UrtB [Casimicrobiaceae bacterium]|nr:urea ABC transporter permease subunit UrtB [Casimicrobiaceae bacterium]